MKRHVFIPDTYPKPKRLPLAQASAGNGKRADFLPQRDIESLFRLRVIVEEKMDGRPAVFSGDNHRFILFVEDMHRVHSIRYWLPARYAIYDVFDHSSLRFLCYDDKASVVTAIQQNRIGVSGCNNLHFFQVPLLARGHFQLDQMPQFLGYTHYPPGSEPVFAEGIVVKPDRELYLPEFVTGKLVRVEFVDGIRTSYLRLPFRKNIIDSKLMQLPTCPGRPTLFPCRQK